MNTEIIQASTSLQAVRPWVRYLARMIDFLMFSFVAGAILGVVLTIMDNIALLDNFNDYLLGFILAFIYVFIEPIILSVCGNTFGKWLLKIKIQDKEGNKPTFAIAFRRSFFVWFYGLGAGFPIIQLFTLISAHSNLTKRGGTTWDKKYNLTVIHQKIGIVRTTIAILLLGLLICSGYILH